LNPTEVWGGSCTLTPPGYTAVFTNASNGNALAYH